MVLPDCRIPAMWQWVVAACFRPCVMLRPKMSGFPPMPANQGRINPLAGKVLDLVDLAFDIGIESNYDQWRSRVSQFLTHAVSPEIAGEFETISDPSWPLRRASQIGMLEGLVQKILQQDRSVYGLASPAGQVAQAVSLSRKVFVVHGHDTEAKESVARFIERLGLEPIILHEQPSSGRTLIEKFEVFADVGFAVVLLTPDDVGAAAGEESKLKARAAERSSRAWVLCGEAQAKPCVCSLQAGCRDTVRFSWRRLC
jgi:hypothetical protein